MRSFNSVEESPILQMHWTEQFFQETAKDVQQGDFIEAMHHVMFYASLLFQRQQGLAAGALIGLPLAWQWGEDEVVAKVKACVPASFASVLDCSLTASEAEACPGSAAGLAAGHDLTETELRKQAAHFIRYAQEQLTSPERTGRRHTTVWRSMYL